MSPADAVVDFRGVRISLKGEPWTTDEVGNILGQLGKAIQSRSDKRHANRDEQKLAILSVFEECFTVEELEAIAYERQIAIETRATDQRAACDAIINHCTRLVVAANKCLRDDSRPLAQVQELERRAHIAKGIRRRWSERLGMNEQETA